MSLACCWAGPGWHGGEINRDMKQGDEGREGEKVRCSVRQDQGKKRPPHLRYPFHIPGRVPSQDRRRGAAPALFLPGAWMIKTWVSHFSSFAVRPSRLPTLSTPNRARHPTRIDALTTSPACRNRIDEPAPDDDDTTRLRTRRGRAALQRSAKGRHASRAQTKRPARRQQSGSTTFTFRLKKHQTTVVDVPPATDLSSTKESARKSRFFKVCGSDRGFWVRQIAPGTISSIGTATDRPRTICNHCIGPLSSRNKKQPLFCYTLGSGHMGRQTK